MNRLQLQATLASATASIFEELALLCADPSADRERAAEPLVGGVRVDFTGPVRGTLVLQVTAGALDAAAANMLALDAPPAEALRRDALGELANVVCGTLLPALVGRRAVFTLDAPRWLDGAAASDGAPVAATSVTLDEGRVDVALHLPDARLSGEVFAA
jgi:CheY-specific phosphatase CheX